MANEKDKPSDPNAETLESQPERIRGGIPKEIGRYKVRRTIGSGGMGTVYEAIQESPRRKVAIKVMRSGVTSRSAMRRFEYESQILGRLSHPCIAQVFEAGTYDDGTGGVPYFAMEYIVGAKTLLEYAKQKDLKVHERLVLFEQICDAVHHGHLKGIIHRDLKPDNILIDSSGNPKIIDFGVARATDSDMALTTLQTNVGQLIGTVQYMSPEQCEADPDLIDARSDVYSLGVILYELLTGQPPYDLSSIPIYEATRLIREQQPTRMTTIAQGIQGDLETVVSKAMDKDRDRRYQSSYELGQDITRFLENEPIHARRASMVYQLKMFARRNRAVVATARFLRANILSW
jgi:serine/threonine protein kinase